MIADCHAEPSRERSAQPPKLCSLIFKWWLQAAALRRHRALQRQVLYTKPVTARAGEPVQVYYNPDNTVLRGRPETWLRGGWNRWTHAQAFPPQRMQPVLPGGVGFLQGTVQVHYASLNFQDLSCACMRVYEATPHAAVNVRGQAHGCSSLSLAQVLLHLQEAQGCVCVCIARQDPSTQ